MKGFDSLREAVEYFSLYLEAVEYSPYKKGENMESYLRKTFNEQFDNSTQKFKSMMRKNNFTLFDLRLMALHGKVGSRFFFEEFLDGITYPVRASDKMLKVMKSSAFKKGKLRRVYLPKKLSNKKELLEFIKEKPPTQHYIIKTVCRFYGLKNWKILLAELTQENKIRNTQEGWY